MHVRKFLLHILVAVILLGSSIVAPAQATGNPNDPNFTGPRVSAPSTLEIKYQPLAPLPLGEGGSTPSEYTLSTYLSGMLKLIIALGAAFAVLMSVVGGIQYVASGITPSKKNEAKDRIWNAITGLVLVLTSYLILNTINPQLVAFNLSLPAVEGTSATPVAEVREPRVLETIARTGCDSFPEISASDWDALAMERGESVVWTSTDANVQRNLDKLRIELAKFETLVASYGASVTINSAYRPLAYQKHLYELSRLADALNSSQSLVQACPQLKQRVDADMAHHGINNAGIVASPNGCAPHVSGIGVDLTINGSVPFSETEGGVNGQLVTRRIDLTWKAIGGDPYHYELLNPPFSGCVN